MSKSNQLLEAHVKYELDLFKGKNLKSQVSGAVNAVWSWMEKEKVNNILDKEKVVAYLERNVKNKKTPKEVKEYTTDLSLFLLKEAKKDETKLTEIIDKEFFDKVMEEISEQEELKNKLIEKAVGNPFYAEMITNTIYNAIKSFTSEEGVAKKIPGASSFLKFGQGLINSAMPDLEETIDRNVKKFINTNLQKFVSQSEKYVKDHLDEDRIQEFGEKAYKKMGKIEVKDIAKEIKDKDIKKGVKVSDDVLSNLKKLDFTKRVVELVIDHFVEYHKDYTIAQLLENMDMSKESITHEAYLAFEPIAESWLKHGTFEKWIRERLSGFYGSDDAKAVLS